MKIDCWKEMSQDLYTCKLIRFIPLLILIIIIDRMWMKKRERSPFYRLHLADYQRHTY
jgi:hypothetical protein